MSSNEVEKRKLILDEFIKNPKQSKRSIAKRLNFAKSTVNSVINRYLKTKTVERKPGSG